MGDCTLGVLSGVVLGVALGAGVPARRLMRTMLPGKGDPGTLERIARSLERIEDEDDAESE